MYPSIEFWKDFGKALFCSYICLITLCTPLSVPTRTHARRYGIAHPAELSPEVHDMEVIRTSMSEHQVPFQEFGDEEDDEAEVERSTDPKYPTDHSGDLSVSFHEVSFAMEDEEVTYTSMQSERLSMSDQIAALDEASSGSDSDVDSVEA